MKLWKILLTSTLSLIASASYALNIPISEVDAYGHGTSLGYVTADDTIYGVILIPHLQGLPSGIHGFAMHTGRSCDNYARAAGGHFDPEKNYQHRGPFRGDGHLGDLPVLIVNGDGRATLPMLAPRLKVDNMLGHSLVIIAGGDNYSDARLTEHRSQQRIACGVIPNS